MLATNLYYKAYVTSIVLPSVPAIKSESGALPIPLIMNGSLSLVDIFMNGTQLKCLLPSCFPLSSSMGLTMLAVFLFGVDGRCS